MKSLKSKILIGVELYENLYKIFEPDYFRKLPRWCREIMPYHGHSSLGFSSKVPRLKISKPRSLF